MKNTTRLKVEILAAVASVLTGVALGEGDFGRNLISGIVSALVVVGLIEIGFRIKKRSEKKSVD